MGECHGCRKVEFWSLYWINIFRSGHTGVWLGPEVEIWGHSFSAVIGVSGDVSNVFRVPLTFMERIGGFWDADAFEWLRMNGMTL